VLSLPQVVQYAEDSGVIVSAYAANEYLKPFSSFLGSFGGERFFALRDAPKYLLDNLARMVDIVQSVSLQPFLIAFYEAVRSRRTINCGANAIQAHAVLFRSVGFCVENGVITKGEGGLSAQQVGHASVRTRMLEIFLSVSDSGGKVPRKAFFAALAANGIKKSTARNYLVQSGLFRAFNGQVEIAVAGAVAAGDGAASRQPAQPCAWLDNGDVYFLSSTA
jgi:hypothetical protein